MVCVVRNSFPIQISQEQSVGMYIVSTTYQAQRCHKLSLTVGEEVIVLEPMEEKRKVKVKSTLTSKVGYIHPSILSDK